MVLPARLEFLDLLSGHRTDEVPILSHVLDDLLVASHPLVLSMVAVTIRVHHVEEVRALYVDLL